MSGLYRWISAFALAVALVAAMSLDIVLHHPARAASTLTVSTTADKVPPCQASAFSLRCAITQANTDGSADTITFNIPSSDSGCSGTPAVCTIKPTKALPTLTASTTSINGYSQPGAHPNTQTFSAGDNAILTIRLDGAAVGKGVDGLDISGTHDTIEGLSITNFALTFSSSGAITGGSGVSLLGSDNIVQGNFIGVTPDGITAGPNQFAGVNIVSSVGRETIGGTVASASNLLSGNGLCSLGDCTGFAVYITSGSGSVLAQNYIGTTATGKAKLQNLATGVVILSRNNTVGGTNAGNIISGSGGDGLLIGASGNLVANNKIGTDATGTANLGNHSHGIEVQGPNNTITKNVISANGDTGLVVLTGGNVIQGNNIGTNATGTAALGNGFSPSAILNGQPINGTDGVTVCVGPNTIGGTTSGAGNIISGNAGNGLSLVSNGNTVQGNRIGTNAAGTAALANGVDGIGFLAEPLKGTGFCQQAPQVGGNNNTIGGLTSTASNLISGNKGHGIVIVKGIGNIVQGNRIGTDVTGTKALGNGGNGVFVSDAAMNETIGGTTTGAGNIIAHNLLSGILIGTGATDTHTHTAVQRNTIFANSGLGIDLAPQGTINCTTSPPGPNDYTQCPVITSATTAKVSGTACTNCTVEVFIATNETDDQGHGEGQTFLGSVTATATGNWSLTLSAGQVSRGQWLTATATTQGGGSTPPETSEFAANVMVMS